MKYRPCPVCGGCGTFDGGVPWKGYALFACPNGHYYATLTAKNGLLLDTKVIVGEGPR